MRGKVETVNGIIDWAKQVFIFSVILTFITGLSPSKKYEPYLKFICGIILAIIILGPVINLFFNGDYMNNLTNELISDFYNVESANINNSINGE